MLLLIVLCTKITACDVCVNFKHNYVSLRQHPNSLSVISTAINRYK